MFQSQGEARGNLTILPKLELRRKLKYQDYQRKPERAIAPGSYELDDAGFAAIGPQGEYGDGNRQGEAARTGAAGIDVENVVQRFDGGLVGMAGDDHAEAGSSWIEGEFGEVVKNMDRVNAGFERVAVRKAPRPGALVVITANRMHRGESLEGLQHGWIADIAGMNDQVRFPQRIEGFWPHQPMSIGD
jgi:hypothetical protein